VDARLGTVVLLFMLDVVSLVVESRGAKSRVGPGAGVRREDEECWALLLALSLT